MLSKYEELLREFIKLKSISTSPKYKDEIEKTAQWLNNLFDKNGFQSETIKGYDNPVVFASYEADKDYETCLIYGHYDVQPADKKDGWKSDPFEVDKRDEKLWGRGVVDNKGQVLIHIFSILELIKNNDLKYNVKFLIEGNEETGSPKLEQLIKDNKEKLDADFIMVSDGETPYKPVVIASYRGIFSCTVKFKTAENTLHSGLFGGAVPNAAEELAAFVTKLNNNDFNSNITDFYKDDMPPDKEEIENAKKMDAERKTLLEKTEIKQFSLGENASFTCRVGFNSMCTVSGFSAGYIEEGYASIIPNTAEVKVNFRIAAQQDPEKVYNRFVKFVEENTPSYVQSTVSEADMFVKPVKFDISTQKHKEVIDILSSIHNEKVLIDYCGATIPIVVSFKEILDLTPLQIPLANDDCNMHGVNENYDIDLLKKGLEFSKRFFSKK